MLTLSYRSGVPLHVYRPLEGDQLRKFSIDTSFESMRSGPIPWLGMVIDFVKGHYKGQAGAIKDVNRYQVDRTRKVTPSGYDSTKQTTKSGLTLTIERYVFTTIASTQVVRVDYDAVRYHK